MDKPIPPYRPNIILPFENRYKTYKILNYGKPYNNYKTYNIRYHPENTSNILEIYIDNQKCNNIPTNKSLLDENIELIKTQNIDKYFVEIKYIIEEYKPNLEYIMTKSDIRILLSKYGYNID
jgi:hypothetical protein